MRVETFCGGFDRNLAYLVWDEDTKEAAVIDTALQAEFIFHEAKQQKLKIKYAFIMHSHFDHTKDLEKYKEKQIKLVAHQGIKGDRDIGVNDNQEIELGKCKLTVLYTPGHTPDGISIFVDDKPPKLFTSDTLFIGTAGRTDIEGGDQGMLLQSLKRLSLLPEDTVVYPGHDYGKTQTSTIGNEKKKNPFMNF
ncbi:MBL fold metallo-hydrolase [Nanoarchaeota archaeon]